MNFKGKGEGGEKHIFYKLTFNMITKKHFRDCTILFGFQNTSEMLKTIFFKKNQVFKTHKSCEPASVHDPIITWTRNATVRSKEFSL